MKALAQYSRWMASLGLAMAVVGLVAAPLAGLAQQRGAAQKLTRLDTLQDLQKVEAGDTIVMTCPKCKETYTQVVEKSFKGSKLEDVKTVPVHLCSECDTKVVHQGVGKQGKDELVHTCKMCGSEEVSCYLLKKDSTAGTHNMENMK